MLITNLKSFTTHNSNTWYAGEGKTIEAIKKKNKLKNLSIVVIGWDEVFSTDRTQKMFRGRIIFCMIIKLPLDISTSIKSHIKIWVSDVGVIPALGRLM